MSVTTQLAALFGISFVLFVAVVWLALKASMAHDSAHAAHFKIDDWKLRVEESNSIHGDAVREKRYARNQVMQDARLSDNENDIEYIESHLEATGHEFVREPEKAFWRKAAKKA